MGTTFAVPNPIPISSILNVNAFVEAASQPGPAFNQACIIGPSAVIPSVGANSRTRLYESLADMLAGGYTTSMPEYKAGALYFGSKPTPTFLWGGRQDLTAIVTAAVGAAGTNYKVGDLVLVTQTGGSLGYLEVSSINPATGAVTELAIPNGISSGTGYTAASGLATTGGSGTSLTVTVTVGETPLQAVESCRANPQWYACQFVGSATDAQRVAVAEYIESAKPASLYFTTISNLNATVGSPPTSLAAALQALALNRTCWLYSTTQGGVYPSNAYAAAAVMGTAMGLNTYLPGSYFTIMFKTINLPGGGTVPVGVQPEPLSNNSNPTVATICGTVDRSNLGLNGNVVLQYSNGGIWTNYGVMASGAFLDQVIFLDMLVDDIQQSGVSLLQSLPSVPMTDAGVAQMKNAIGAACVRSQNIGFIAPTGTWLNAQLGAPPTVLANGQALPKGYWIYAQPMSQYSEAQKANRVMPPITVALVEAQAGQSLSVTVYVQP